MESFKGKNQQNKYKKIRKWFLSHEVNCSAAEKRSFIRQVYNKGSNIKMRLTSDMKFKFVGLNTGDLDATSQEITDSFKIFEGHDIVFSNCYLGDFAIEAQKGKDLVLEKTKTVGLDLKTNGNLHIMDCDILSIDKNVNFHANKLYLKGVRLLNRKVSLKFNKTLSIRECENVKNYEYVLKPCDINAEGLPSSGVTPWTVNIDNSTINIDVAPLDECAIGPDIQINESLVKRFSSEKPLENITINNSTVNFRGDISAKNMCLSKANIKNQELKYPSNIKLLYLQASGLNSSEGNITTGTTNLTENANFIIEQSAYLTITQALRMQKNTHVIVKNGGNLKYKSAELSQDACIIDNSKSTDDIHNPNQEPIIGSGVSALPGAVDNSQKESKSQPGAQLIKKFNKN